MPPAARVSDMHTCPMVTPGTPPVPHVGGPILPPGAPTVLIGYMPAARVSDMATCVGPPDSIVKGSTTVLISYMPAARIGDSTAHGGVIVAGCPTVMIGDSGSGGAGGGGGAAAAGSSSAADVLDEFSGPGMDTDFATAFVLAGPVIAALTGAARSGAAAVAASGAASPAKTFATAEDAAVAAMKEANPKSVKEGREYGGWIRKNEDGTYSYDPPVRGSKDGLTNMPDKGPSDVVWYHTHGADDPGYDNENFSGATGDKGYSKANNAVGYLATPRGAIKKYDPTTGDVTTLPNTAPP